MGRRTPAVATGQCAGTTLARVVRGSAKAGAEMQTARILNVSPPHCSDYVLIYPIAAASEFAIYILAGSSYHPSLALGGVRRRRRRLPHRRHIDAAERTIQCLRGRSRGNGCAVTVAVGGRLLVVVVVCSQQILCGPCVQCP